MDRPATEATLVIICGLPGAGKTTHARRLEHDRRAVRFCPDEWITDLSLNLYDPVRREQIEALQWRLALRLLSLGQTVLIEWGTWTQAERDDLREQANGVGARVELHYLTAPVDVLFDRVQRRAMEDPPIRYQDYVRWAGQFEVPTEDERSLYDATFEFAA